MSGAREKKELISANNGAMPTRTPSTVIITGPPWPRSGTGRVIQSQIQYYRSRGFQTVFIAVPFRWNFFRDSSVWDEFRDGLNALGANHTFLAAIEPKEFRKAKYAATLRHGLRGTALDWLIAMAASAQLTPEQRRLVVTSNVKLIHVNHVFTLGFALRLKRQLSGKSSDVPMLLDTHDIQSYVVQEKRETNPWTRRLDSAERLLRSEIEHLRRPDVLVHLSIADFDFFKQRISAGKHFLILPTINEEFVRSVRESSDPAEPIDLLFVADWHAPNLAAIRWFFGEVWPQIANRNYDLKIVGRIALGVESELPTIYADFRKYFIGEVADLTSYYRATQCVIAPMVSGSGISIKTVEALGAGKAFVGTSKAFRGMPLDRLKELGIQAHDHPNEFADAIVNALQNREAAERVSRAAYDALFSTEACFAQRDEAMQTALQKTEGALAGSGPKQA